MKTNLIRYGFTGRRVKPLSFLPESLLNGFEEALLAKVILIIIYQHRAKNAKKSKYDNVVIGTQKKLPLATLLATAARNGKKKLF